MWTPTGWRGLPQGPLLPPLPGSLAPWLLPGYRGSRQSRARSEPMVSTSRQRGSEPGEGKGHLTSRKPALAQQRLRLLPEEKTREWQGGWPPAGRKQAGGWSLSWGKACVLLPVQPWQLHRPRLGVGATAPRAHGTATHTLWHELSEVHRSSHHPRCCKTAHSASVSCWASLATWLLGSLGWCVFLNTNLQEIETTFSELLLLFCFVFS